MKAIGIVRRLDGLGRIVIPAEIRRELRVGKDDPMEISSTADGIVIRQYRVGCVCCGNEKNLAHVDDIALCPACIQRFQNAPALPSD